MPFVVRDVAYDGTSVLLHFKKHEFAFQSITYGDNIDGAEFTTSMGHQEQGGQTRGIYKTESSTVKQLRAEWDRMMIYFPSNGFGNSLFPVTTNYQDPTLGKSTDKLFRCRILGVKLDIESSGKANMVEFKMSVGQIVWNGKSINKRSGAPGTPFTL